MKPIRQAATAVLFITFSWIIPIAGAQVSTGGAELLRELSNRNADKVRQLIDQDPSLLEFTNPKGSTPLTIAASMGQTELVRYLIGKGANVNAVNNYGNTPLHYAAWAADLTSFKALFEKGARLDALNSQGQTPFPYACMGGSFDIFRFCSDKGADIHAAMGDGSSMIHWAAYGGNLEIFKYLESQGLDPNTPDRDGDPPLCWAISGNRENIVRYLVEEKKADLNMNLSNNRNLLMVAAETDNPGMIRMLAEQGCNVNEFDNSGRTPLMIAAGHGNFESVKELVRNGAKTNPGLCVRKSCTNRGETPLHYAAWRYPAIVEYLIESGADVNGKDLQGATPLHSASGSDSIRNVEILCEHGANVNAQDNLGETPLIKAVRRQKNQVIETLVKWKADPSLQDSEGKTALHYAAINGCEKTVDYLVGQGVDVNVKDKSGHAPAYYATFYGNDKIAERLHPAGTAVEKMPAGMTGLAHSSLKEGEAVIWYLNHSGWAVKTKDHLLVFDYWQNTEDPDHPCLDNGRIDPEEIAGLNVVVFASHNHNDHYSPAIFGWSEKVKNIRYVLGFETAAPGPYAFIPPRTEEIVDGVRIRTATSTDSGEGFIVETDGVTLYHPGDHARRYTEADPDFSRSVDFLAEGNHSIDIAFIPVSGCGFSNTTALKAGNDEVISKFSPRMVFPMHGSMNEKQYREYVEEKIKAGDEAPYQCASFQGDRFTLKNEE